MKLSENAKEWAEASYAECLVEASEIIEKDLPTIAFEDHKRGSIANIATYLQKKSYDIVVKRVEIYIEAFKKDRQIIDDEDEKEIIEDIKRVIIAMYGGDIRRLERLLLSNNEEYKSRLFDEIKRKYDTFLGKAALKFAKAKAEIALESSYQKSNKNRETLDLSFKTLTFQQIRVSQSSKLRNLRNTITSIQQKIINKILDFYLNNQKWILELTLCLELELSSEEIEDSLKSLGGMIVWIDLNDPNQKRYVLGFLGLLLSRIENEIELLLIHYLAFVRDKLLLGNEMKFIKLSEVIQTLALDKYRVFMLRLSFQLPGNPFGGLQGSMSDPDVSLPNNHINLALAKDIEAYFAFQLDSWLDLGMPLESNKQQFYIEKKYYEKKLQESSTKLEKDKKNMITVKAVDVKDSIDFGIITIRDDEHRAVLARFPTVGIIKGERSYALSEIDIDGSNDKYRIAIVRTFNEGGEGEAQNTSQAMINDLDPTWLLLVGIAGGVLSDDFTLGDVLIANRLLDFCIGAETLTGVSYDVRGGPMHPHVQDYIYSLAVVEERFKDWNTNEAINQEQPPVDVSDGHFYEKFSEEGKFNEEYKTKIRNTLLKHFGDPPSFRFPKIAVATNVSTDRLIKDPRVIKLWQTTARKIQSIEMELAGVYIAARKKKGEYPILAIRGISDIVGFERDDAWTKYACNTAASLAYFLLKYTRPVEPKQSTDNLIESNVNIQPLPNNKTKSDFKDKMVQISLEQRQELYNKLTDLPEPIFEGFLAIVKPTQGTISSSTGQQARRVLELITWAESSIGIGLVKLTECLDTFIHQNPQ